MAKGKPISDAARRAHVKYMAKFVEIKVRMTPDRRAIVQGHAQQMGESTTVFINRAIDEAMARDKAKGG